MQTAPKTDKTLGIKKDWEYDRFRDVRKKAKLEEEMRYKKARKDKKVKFPKFKIGDEVVLSSGWDKTHFHLVAIIDCENSRHDSFSYYGIVKRTTDPKLTDRIGRLLKFNEANWWRTDYAPANIDNQSIKWTIVSEGD